MTRSDTVQVVLTLLAIYARRPLPDDAATRRLGLREAGINSLSLAAVVVELEDRLERELDLDAFAAVETVGHLLRAVGADPQLPPEST